MEKLYLILNQSGTIVGFVQTSDISTITQGNLAPTNGSIVSISPPADENLDKLNGSIFSVVGSIEDPLQSIPEATYYSTANINYKPDSGIFWEYQNSVWIDSRPVSVLQQVSKIEIDSEAEQSRRRYITAWPGQVAVYNEKYLDAQAYADAGYPTITGSQYPFIQAEAAAANLTSQQAADLILTTRTMWIALAAQIEEDRRRGKIAVDNATTEGGVTSATQTAINLLRAI